MGRNCTGARLPSLGWLTTATVLAAASSPAEAQSCAGMAPVQIEIVSLSDVDLPTQGCTVGGCKNNSHPAVDGAGLNVVFSSDAAQVVTGFSNGANLPQVYLRPMGLGTTLLLSRGLTPGSVANAPCDFPLISLDGRLAAFSSGADNLVPADTNLASDVFIVDTRTLAIERVSRNPNGTQFNGQSSAPHVSGDGRAVVFVSDATNPSPLIGLNGTSAALPGTEQVLLLDRKRGRFEFISAGRRGTVPDGPAGEPRIDASGIFVSFSSEATNLGFVDTNGPIADVFVASRNGLGLRLVSSSWGNPRRTCASQSRRPAISADGRWVVFESAAPDLLAPGVDTNGLHDVFVRDLQTGQIALVSGGYSGASANGGSGYGAISGDGRFVMFTSTATNLVPADTTSFLECFVRDRDTDGDNIYDEMGATCTWRLSASVIGTPANARSGGNGALSLDGRFAVFMSEADTLVGGDLNGSAPGAACSPTCLFGRDVFRARLY